MRWHLRRLRWRLRPVRRTVVRFVTQRHTETPRMRYIGPFERMIRDVWTPALKAQLAADLDRQIWGSTDGSVKELTGLEGIVTFSVRAS